MVTVHVKKLRIVKYFLDLMWIIPQQALFLFNFLTLYLSLYLFLLGCTLTNKRKYKYVNHQLFFYPTFLGFLDGAADWRCQTPSCNVMWKVTQTQLLKKPFTLNIFNLLVSHYATNLNINGIFCYCTAGAFSPPLTQKLVL